MPHLRCLFRSIPPVLAMVVAVMVPALASAHAQSVSGWQAHVSPADRERTNPLPAGVENTAAGQQLYLRHCATCHGASLEGRGRRPSLRPEHLLEATDGELFWLLRNGSLAHGMPSWSSLPEPERWQIIGYLRSLPARSQP